MLLLLFIFLYTLYSSKNPEKIIPGNKKILSSTTVSKIDNKHIRMISEESCDTEDRSNGVQNSALHHRNTLYFKVY